MHDPPHVPPCASGCSVQPDGAVVVVVLLVLVVVLLLVLVDDDVLLVVGPKQPQWPPPMGPQSSPGLAQSRSASGQLGGASCVQSAIGDTQAHVPFMRSQRHTSPAPQAPPQVPPCPSGCSAHGPAGMVVVDVLLVLVVVVLVLVEDDVLLVVGPPEHPHCPPPIGPQSSAGRAQSRLGSGQFGGESCVQSETPDTQAQVPFIRSHRHTSAPAHAPPHVPPNPSGCSEHDAFGAVVVVVLLVLVVVVLLVDDEVVLVVGPKQPQCPPLMGPQSSTGRGQSRVGSGQPGGDSCEQSEVADTHAHVPFIRSHRQTRPAAHVPPHIPPASDWNAHGPNAGVTAATQSSTRVPSAVTSPEHDPYPSAVATAATSLASAFAVHCGSTPSILARKAFCRHVASANASFPTAFVFAEAHCDSPATAPVKLVTHAAAAAPSESASATTVQPPLASALANAAWKRFAALARQSGLTAPPPALAFA
jgi:hypothetical protein